MSYVSSDETEASCYLPGISQAICSPGWAAGQVSFGLLVFRCGWET